MELLTELMLKYLEGDISSFGDSYKEIIIDKNLVLKYISKLNNGTLTDIDTQNLYDNYEISYGDILYQYFFDVFFS